MHSPAISKQKRGIGGSFLIEDFAPQDIFTVEDFSDVQRQIERTTVEFAEKHVLPQIAAIEAKEFEITKQLLRKAGSLGLMGIDVPEEYGGLQMDKVTSALIAEKIAICGSFSVSFSAHVGIGTLPLVWYGTADQKKRFLPRLASGEWVAAYALSESSSGSDAMNIRTQAKLSADGKHAVLSLSTQPFAGAHPVLNPGQQGLILKAPGFDNIESDAQVGIGGPQPQYGVFVGDLRNRHCLDFFDVHGWIRQAAARVIPPRRVCHNHLEWPGR